MSHHGNLTPKRYNEVCRLMSIGYAPRHAAYIVNVDVSQVAEMATGQGGEPGIKALELECRFNRIGRIAANIADYPNVSLFSSMAEAA